MNITEALKWGKDQLASSDVTEPQASAEVLLSHVLGTERADLVTERDRLLTITEYTKYRRYIKRRQKHESVWQIIGEVEFWGMPYLVTKDVLVPRPETEILVSTVLEQVKKSKLNSGRILDLGTGSGTIAIALAKELPGFQVFASDVSSAALSVAKKNAKKLLAGTLVTFRRGSLLAPWKDDRFDIICANLPYIPSEDMVSLQFDVLHHEPRLALDGGPGGLAIYEEFLAEVGKYLNSGGMIFGEIGIGQGKALTNLVLKYLPDYECEIRGDLAGIDRIAIIKKSK